MTNPYITPELFGFFRDLSKNNNRDWFQRNKSRYEQMVRDPLLAFVFDVAPRLQRISPYLVADSRPTGGALFRIYRDVRFSKDKRPYKTHAGLRFPHEDRRNVHAPGYYLHLEPGSVFAGCGIWHPDAAVLRQVRDAIVEDPKGWKRVTSKCTLGGDSLRKPPRGYDPEHPLVSDLKRKDFVAYAEFTEHEACDESFMRRFADACKTMKPLMGFLTRAVGASW